jgi:hypothetical protein
VLWRWGTVSGVVDWQSVCTGPAVIDVAHCRVNLLTFGTGAAEQFTAWWQRASGAAYHPWADVVTIIGFLDDLREDGGSEQFLVAFGRFVNSGTSAPHRTMCWSGRRSKMSSWPT